MNNKFSTLLRIYFYSDADRRYGDAGTFRYVKVTKAEFTSETCKYFSGASYIKYTPKPELREKLKSLGYDYYTMGFDVATEEKYNAELATLREKLTRLETI